MARQVSRAHARSFLVGIVSIAVLGLVGYVAATANEGRLPGAATTTVRAAFADIGQLQTTSDVRLNGVYVGRVSAIDMQADGAVVTMDLNRDVPMYSDAYAGIWDQSALAQKYVELRAGTPESGPLGDAVIPREQTESTHDLVDLLDVFQPDTRDALGRSVRALGGGAAGFGPGLHDFIAAAPGMLDGVGRISGSLSSDQADLPAMLRSTDRLMGRFQEREARINSLLAQTDQTMRALDVDEGRPLAAALKALPATLRSVREAFDAAQVPLEDTEATMRTLRDGAAALGRATPDLRGVLREGVEPLNTVPEVAESAEPAVDELTSVFADARPFVPRVADGLSSAAPVLATLSPYGKDIATAGFDIANAIENHNGWEHRLRLFVGIPTGGNVAGQFVEDSHDPYPGPGDAIPGTGARNGN
jgi:phospholipid/cholesterol/gamma-HCH transport system substrate-binding protein